MDLAPHRNEPDRIWRDRLQRALPYFSVILGLSSLIDFGVEGHRYDLFLGILWVALGIAAIVLARKGDRAASSRRAC